MASLTITVNNLNIRKGPATSYASVGKYNKGKVVESTEKLMVGNERWYKLTTGLYICGYQPSSGWFLKDTQSTASSTDLKKPVTKSSGGSTSTTSKGKGIDAAIIGMLNGSINLKKGTIDPNTRHLGQPHQFLKSTDYRNAASVDMGRKFLENVFSEAPILTIIPGRPNYMPDATDEQRAIVAGMFDGKGRDKDTISGIADLKNKSGDMRYFSFTADYSEYIRYVNMLCRITAIYIGLGETIVPGSQDIEYKRYNWANYKYRDSARQKNVEQESVFNMGIIDTIRTAVGSMANEVSTPDYVNLYVDANVSFGEDSSNSTTQSQLESTISDTLEGLSKEVSFWLNAGGAGMADDIKQGMAASIGSIADSNLTKSGGILDRVIGSSTNILQGSNMIFPEIWSDSSYGKSYSVNMTLQSPYGDKESIYLNVLVPMMHVLALSLPRQTSANSFTSPFLIRSFCPGWFVCDMGMMSSLSIEKGEWTVDGLPSEVKISFQIKDLYDQLMMTKTTNPGDLFNNDGLMDFLGVTAGLDLLKPQFKTKQDTMVNTLVNKLVDIPANVYQEFNQNSKNMWMDLFGFK